MSRIVTTISLPEKTMAQLEKMAETLHYGNRSQCVRALIEDNFWMVTQKEREMTKNGDEEIKE